jgi:hypothetical protein
MKLPEFVGGFIAGASILFLSLGIVFMPKLQPELPAVLLLELLVLYIAGIVAGLGLGFGLKSDEYGFGFSFSGDLEEKLPILIGSIAFAAIFGITLLLALGKNPTPTLALVLGFISSLLITFGLIITIVAWESAPY